MDHLRLLLVEDSDADAFLLEEHLEKVSELDVEVQRVTRLDDAIRALDQTQPDVILYDLALPDARGLPGFRRLADQARSVPIVILTGLDDPLVAEEALRYRAQDYLPKGDVTPQTLARSLRYAIERHRLLNEIEGLSLRDALTGLYNRRGFELLASQQLLAARRNDVGVALLYLDIDGFKRVNDALGHGRGDAILEAVAAQLVAGCRKGDIPARLGGDEFAVLVTNGPFDDQTIRGLADRMCASIAEGTVDGDARGIVVTVGTARWKAESDWTLDELLAAGDADMYEHKRRRAISPLD